jgi:hypothetical protein
MAERRKPKAASAGKARPPPASPEPRRPERAPLDALPGSFPAPLAFPWASALAIGWGSLPVRPVPTRSAPPAPQRRRRVAE